MSLRWGLGAGAWLLACTPDPHPFRELPETVDYGDHLTVFLESEEDLCAGTLPYLDAYAGEVMALHGGAEARLPYYWLSNDAARIEAVCDGNAACNVEGSVVTSTMPRSEMRISGITTGSAG